MSNFHSTGVKYIIPQTMQTTRKAARDAGDKLYFNESPCSRGHIAPRYVSTANCSLCTAAQRKRWKEANPEKMRASGAKYRRTHAETCRAKNKRWMLENPKTQMLASARYRAAKAGLEFSITHEHIVIPERCPVLGFVLSRGCGRQAPYSPSLDRVDTRRGYVPGNIQVISHRANTLKGDATAEELAALARYAAGSNDTKTSHGRLAQR